jgi:hypothetical protein
MAHSVPVFLFLGHVTILYKVIGLIWFTVTHPFVFPKQLLAANCLLDNALCELKSCLSGKTTIYSAVSHWEGQTTSVKRKERLPTSNYLTRGFSQARTSDSLRNHQVQVA